ncbi:hypothetical protein LXL04_003679 [Taraxacum kok-saghyz]
MLPPYKEKDTANNKTKQTTLTPHNNQTYKRNGIKHLIKHPVKLISSLHNTVTIIAINHKDKPLCVLEVVPPQWPDLKTTKYFSYFIQFQSSNSLTYLISYLVLTSNIPHCKADVLVLHSLHIKPCKYTNNHHFITNSSLTYKDECFYDIKVVPMVGMVVTISPNLSLYKIVVLPAASRPTIRIRISFLANKRLKSLAEKNKITDRLAIAGSDGDRLKWGPSITDEARELYEGDAEGSVVFKGFRSEENGRLRNSTTPKLDTVESNWDDVNHSNQACVVSASSPTNTKPFLDSGNGQVKPHYTSRSHPLPLSLRVPQIQIEIRLPSHQEAKFSTSDDGVYGQGHGILLNWTVGLFFRLSFISRLGGSPLSRDPPGTMTFCQEDNGFSETVGGKDKEIWRSIEQGSHVPTLTQRAATDVEAALGGEPILTLTQDDLLKMKADDMATTEINCAIHPDVFDLVEDCESTHEIWTTLHKLFAGTEAPKDKKIMSALNAYSDFKALPNESLQATFKRFKVVISRLKNSGNEKSNLEVNLIFHQQY